MSSYKIDTMTVERLSTQPQAITLGLEGGEAVSLASKLLGIDEEVIKKATICSKAKLSVPVPGDGEIITIDGPEFDSFKVIAKKVSVSDGVCYIGSDVLTNTCDKILSELVGVPGVSAEVTVDQNDMFCSG